METEGRMVIAGYSDLMEAYYSFSISCSMYELGNEYVKVVYKAP